MPQALRRALASLVIQVQTGGTWVCVAARARASWPGRPSNEYVFGFCPFLPSPSTPSFDTPEYGRVRVKVFELLLLALKFRLFCLVSSPKAGVNERAVGVCTGSKSCFFIEAIADSALGPVLFGRFPEIVCV